MDSRGSLLMRRAGSLSMLTCGRAMMTGWLPAKDTDAMGPGPGGPGSYPGFAIPIDMASS